MGWQSTLHELDEVPYRLTGVVYATQFNHKPSYQALAAVLHEAPYMQPPQTPILSLKPRNTLRQDGDRILIPLGVPALEVGASLGIVIRSTACRLQESSALDHVAGYVIVNDLTVPNKDYSRRNVRFAAQDGFCPLGSAVSARSLAGNPDELEVRVYIDGTLAQVTTTGERIRGVARLLTDVTEFMTLTPGDVLTLGVSAGAPCVSPGQQARIEIKGLGALENAFVAERFQP